MLTDHTKYHTYCDVRYTIEHEIVESNSPSRKQFCALYEHQQNPKVDIIFAMEVSLPDVDKFLNDYRCGKIKRQDSNNLSMINHDVIGTFSIEDLDISTSSNFDGEKLEVLRVQLC